MYAHAVEYFFKIDEDDGYLSVEALHILYNSS